MRRCRFTDNAPNSPQSVPLSGTGIQPSISFTPPSISFPNQQVGTTSGPQTLAVTNTGTAPLTISSIAPTGTNAGDFQLINNNCITTVAPNGTCTLQVTFTPTAHGRESASLSFTDNAPDSPQTVSLSGTGTPSGLAAPTITTQPADQTVNVGQTATLSVVATGSQPLSYQWYQGQSGNTSAPVSGATNSSFTTPALTSTVLYWVQVTNGVPPVLPRTAAPPRS